MPRYDLLCLEGLARGLRVFTGKEEVPTYSLADMSSRAMLKMTVKPEVGCARYCHVHIHFYKRLHWCSKAPFLQIS